MTDKNALHESDKLARAKQFLAERGKGTVKRLSGPHPKYRNFGFYSTLPTSYRQATGQDMVSMDRARWEKIAEKAFRLFLA